MTGVVAVEVAVVVTFVDVVSPVIDEVDSVAVSIEVSVVVTFDAVVGVFLFLGTVTVNVLQALSRNNTHKTKSLGQKPERFLKSIDFFVKI